MSDLFRDPNAGWAALLIVVLPLVIIGAGELDERLRQRDSPLRPSVSVLRIWVVPLLTIWILARALFDASADSFPLQLLGSALVLALGAAALTALRVLVSWLGGRSHDGRRSIPRLLLALPRLFVILATIWFLIAGVWNVDLSAAMTALGVTSLIISFALQDTLSGVASGFLLLADQPFQPGDWIEVGDIEGRVLDINWRASRIQTRNGDLLIVPNGHLAGATITNFDEPTRVHRVVVPLQVAYINAPTMAKHMLLDAARSTPGVLTDPAPQVRVVQIDDPLMGYEVHMWIDDYAIAPTVKSDFGALVWYHSHRHDVPLPSPAQDLYLYDGVQAGLVGGIDLAEIRRRLAASPPFDELDPDDLDNLAEGTTATRYASGETIVSGGAGHGLHILYDGQARIVLRGVAAADATVLDLDTGDLFGVLQDAEDSAVQSAIIAVTDCDVLIIPETAAARVISRNPQLAEAVEQLSATRQRRIQRVRRRILEHAITKPKGDFD